ncbi:MAG: CDP-diacylglycerol--glycerol-3-phosphate 3-phosphatidyltransferase [Myxococcota bacterium]
MTKKKHNLKALKTVPKILKLKFTKRKKLKDYKGISFSEEISSLPNLITVSRLVLIPLILYFLQTGTVRGHYFAALFFLLAGISDGVDGYLARKFNKITLLGKFLDPLADKMTTLSIMVYLVLGQLIPPWLLVLVLFRELAITGLRTIAMGEGVVISASQSGKSKTAFQFVGLTFLLTHYPYYLLGTSIILDYHRMGLYILYLSLIMSLFSAFEYVALFIEAVEQKNRKKRIRIEKAVRDAGIIDENSISNPDLPVIEEHNMELEIDES